ncbi:MAG: sigma-70 family RNA polymerase sigma factor [Thermoguttaceae bacterium]|nr:sigma-70 family RNA polymerase sigma factor [Thermoguttaceae bacterium]MDW8037075.1 sigma-70 family RNA polymerase sigma factor [Thermoguttaceae bacterium]
MGASELSSGTLWIHLGQGDPEAWQEYYRRYAPRLLAVAKKLGLSRDEAHELPQEVGVRILLGKVRWGRQGRLGDFLAGVAKNLSRLFKSRRSREIPAQPHLLPENLQRPRSPNAHQEETIAMVMFLMDRVGKEFPPQDVQIFELMEIQQYTAAETYRVLFHLEQNPHAGKKSNNQENEYKKLYKKNERVKKRFKELAIAYRDHGPPDEYIEWIRRQAAYSSTGRPPASLH